MASHPRMLGQGVCCTQERHRTRSPRQCGGWLQQNNPSADDLWWTAATKKRLRGVDARDKSDSTLLRELGVVKGSRISVEIPASFPVNGDGVLGGAPLLPATLPPPGLST